MKAIYCTFSSNGNKKHSGDSRGKQMTFVFLCFWRAFSDAQESYDQALEKHQQLTKELLSQQKKEQGIGRHFLIVDGFLKKAVNESFPNV